MQGDYPPAVLLRRDYVEYQMEICFKKNRADDLNNVDYLYYIIFHFSVNAR